MESFHVRRKPLKTSRDSAFDIGFEETKPLCPKVDFEKNTVIIIKSTYLSIQTIGELIFWEEIVLNAKTCGELFIHYT